MSSGLQSPPKVSQYWLLLAISALGLAALAAIFLVLARTPVLTALVAPNAFPRALVVHVNLATTIWYLAMANALWTETLPQSRHRAATVILTVSSAGMAGVVWQGFATAGAPVLANYIPYVDATGFLVCLAVFAGGGIASSLLSLTRPRDAAGWGFAIARWPFLMALIYLVAGWLRHISLPDALWGAGHILQFGYITLLMAIWLRLAEQRERSPLPRRFAVGLFCAASLPATVAPLLLLSGQLDAESLHSFHTQLMRYANWPAPLLLAASLLLHPAAKRQVALLASIALFVVGIIAGLLITSQTTIIPAHYHGTIGAFTLAQMAAALIRVSPRLPAQGGFGRGLRSIQLYTIGIVTLICGLAWSGWLGAPRKVGFDSHGADLSATLAAATVGTGGAVAILGICSFALLTLPRTVKLCLSQFRPETAPPAAATFAAVR
ncbi:MAG TPA: hypothetical protein VJ673_07240 [Aromatoleum sp.]|uniref:hypothetical protein n=1 Tax=Aromatoleum sp. TaxID=2307007 RepID=UPI002B470859|nr:hypothetical protein [Aromatoleum sp.]HJV25463.1 hypothetical protein [Aromatoleum sp.]